MDKLIPKIILSFLIISIMTFSEKAYTNNNHSSINYVRYGISCGESDGDCSRSIQISETKINFEKGGKNVNSKSSNNLISETIINEYWVQLVNAIDFDNFMQLESIVSADGDIEWIEIKKKGKIYKVTFEYGNEPETLKGYIGFLRTYMASFEIDSLGAVNFNERTLINKEGKIKNFFCSRGCSQYVIELIENNTTTYYFDKDLESKYQKDGLSIRFNGVIQFDSTVINKPSPRDIPIPDFVAKNIRMINVNINTD
ncbi:MAG: hypothetical protein GQ564_06075 [Bacteroidales bacterium]|nr:hypothetical protein [Bacteroidales bacterium]